MHRWRSDSLTVIKTPEGIDSNKIVKHAFSRYNLSIGIGLSQVCRVCLWIGWRCLLCVCSCAASLPLFPALFAAWCCAGSMR